MKKQSNTPKIRFHNYKELWECDDLKNIFGTIRNAFVGTATPYYVEKGHFYLESNNVKNGKINYNSQIFINDEFYEKQRDKWLKTNDIVMVQSGHVGHTAVIPEELDNTAAHALIVFTDYNKEVNPHFLNYQFQSNSKRKELDLISTGNTIKHILASEMKNFKMDFPTVDEQSAIGFLFRTLDDLLVSYKDNFANYQSLKSTMLSKMFPKAGQTVPEIRLGGFEGKWEVQTLKELASFSKGNGYTKNDLVNSGKEIILYGRLYTNYQTVISQVNTFVTKVKANAVISKGGEVIVPASGESAEDISRASVVEKSGVILGGDLNIIYPDESKVDSIFLALTISNGSQQKELIKRAQGKSVVHLRNNDLEKVLLHYPSMEEQQAIGSYFSNLDNLINSHQEKISQLETLKKKLLQDMFI